MSEDERGRGAPGPERRARPGIGMTVVLVVAAIAFTLAAWLAAR